MLLIDFCRSNKCFTRKVIDAPAVDGYISKEQKQDIVEGKICESCMAWKYQRFIEEHDERYITRN